MKLTTLMLLIALVHASAASFSQVKLNTKNAPLESVLKTLKDQTGYTFFYDLKDIRDTKVTVQLANASLKEALDKCLTGSTLGYEIEDKTVFISKKQQTLLNKLEDKIKEVFAPPTAITGKVTDETGQPMAGVTVKIKSTGGATATDKSGAFEITVPNDQEVIVFSSVGYETQEITAKNITKGGTITLKAVATNLQEVVVNKGPYSVKQELNTGDVTVVTSATLHEQPVTDPIDALIGRVPGLNIQQTSGIPGAFATIRIRGQNSINNGNDPFYIVDGVPFTSTTLSAGGGLLTPFGSPNQSKNVSGTGMSPFNALSLDDIESIEILKDADATAIYGSRGANGVILITTKKGKPGAPRFNLDMQQGVGQIDHKINFLNTAQYIQLRKEAYTNDGLPVPSFGADPTDVNYDINGYWDQSRYTDWQKVLIGNSAGFTNMKGSLSGGTTEDQYLLSAGYSRQGTVYPGSFSDKKISVLSNWTHSSVDKKFTSTFSASYVNDNNQLPYADLTGYITLPPDAPAMYDQYGKINWQTLNGNATFYSNPASVLLQPSNALTNNLVSSINLSYQLATGLSIKATAGYNHDEMQQQYLSPLSAIFPPYNTDPSFRSSTFANTELNKWVVEPQLNYHRKTSAGTFDLLLGSSFQSSTTSSLTTNAQGFVNDAFLTNPQAASVVALTGSNYLNYKYSAIYGRVGYNLDDKYLVNLTARRDGSSRFGPGKQFGDFGAVGAAWLFSKEQFIQRAIPFLSFGKLRASYGTTGNDQIPDYQFLSTYSTSSGTYQGLSGLAPTGLANPDLRWEVVKKLEFGLDAGFLNDRINLSLSYYRNRTGNQLISYGLASSTGFANIQYNLPAVVQNAGTEISLNTNNILNHDFKWNTNFTLTVPENKLVAFPNIAAFPNYVSSYTVGQSLFARRIFHYTGIDPQSGVYTFATSNTSGLPANADKISGPAVTQQYYGGLQNTFSYKQWSLDIFVQYVKQLGRDYRTSPTFAKFGFNFDDGNAPVEFLNRWQPGSNSATVQKLSTDYSVVTRSADYLSASDGIITDASFIRLKNVSLAYRLPEKWTSQLHMQSARIYLQGQNLLTLTHYKVLDPETQTLSLPPLRMITAGLQVTF
ncbi:SusC/RagA family TonB-linked outer membrane protein [Mucilaginibacter ximonensis]|uniref:SusC/RagA family TonB-linked outer membrane protein n=1 Tax=Mucilaginibacter ximonensis TaxID=538021 RepID=A0ABW5Y974_9SPHI